MKDNIIEFPEKKADDGDEGLNENTCLNGKAARDFLHANDDHVACFVISLDAKGEVNIGAAGDKCKHYPEILCRAIFALEMSYNTNEFYNDNAS